MTKQATRAILPVFIFLSGFLVATTFSTLSLQGRSDGETSTQQFVTNRIATASPQHPANVIGFPTSAQDSSLSACVDKHNLCNGQCLIEASNCINTASEIRDVKEREGALTACLNQYNGCKKTCDDQRDKCVLDAFKSIWDELVGPISQ